MWLHGTHEIIGLCGSKTRSHHTHDLQLLGSMSRPLEDSSPIREYDSPSVTLTSPSALLNVKEICFHDVSLTSSLPICRICHCSSEEEELIQPCRCSGSVRYAHQSCLRTWIVGSSHSSCELCQYKFKTERKLALNVRQLKCPRPTFKGWLHIFLFLAFFSIMLTSLTWFMWSQLSNSREAKMERENEGVIYAYAVNGGFIFMALLGLYLDSYKQCRSYYQRWYSQNQHLVIFPFDAKGEADISNKNSNLHFTSANTADADANERLAASVNKTTQPRYSTLLSHQEQVIATDAAISNTSHKHSTDWGTSDNEWSLIASTYILPTNSRHGHSTLHQSKSEPADLRSFVILTETYV